MSIEVFDRTFAIATCRQRVRHQTHAVLANVKGVLAVMREIRVAIRHDHLRNAQAVEDHPAALLIHVVDRHIGNNDSFTVVETDVHLETCPRKLVPVHGERHAFRLCNVNGLEAVGDVTVLDEPGEEVVRLSWHRYSFAVNPSDVDAENLFPLGINNHAKVERMSILVVEFRRTPVSQPLLQASIEAVAFVGPDSPAVEVDLIHVINANVFAGLDDAGIGAGDSLADVEVFQRQDRHHVVDGPGRHDAFLRQADEDLVDLAGAIQEDDDEGPAVWTWAVGITPGDVLGLDGVLGVVISGCRGECELGRESTFNVMTLNFSGVFW
jgi:hypothetical protein